MSYNIVSGTTQVIYHKVPSDESIMLTTPKQEAILAYLSQISFSEFPEFIRDILVKVEGHTILDITDGPGDEKQDILTKTSDGKRCLTQCKHKIDYTSNANGNDLDLLVSACLRKDCRQALFVTNGDLTPQAKRYITDKEYNRGWPSSDPFIVDYWNNLKIWDKIQSNADILNKWFSGLGQTHGLRKFKFDLTVQKMPYQPQQQDNNHDKIIEHLKEQALIKEVVDRLHYYAEIENEIIIHVKQWFQFSAQLDINYTPPGNDNLDFLHKPLYALTVEVALNNQNSYSPTVIRERVIKYLLETTLEKTTDDQWWHITASQSIGFVYLHDLREPRKLIIDSAETFIKVGDGVITSELKHCKLDSEFSIKSTEEDDQDDIYVHQSSGYEIIQLFNQKINPVEDYNYQVIQRYQLSTLSENHFRAIESIDSKMMMRVRRMLPMDWIAFQMNEDALIWCFPQKTDTNLISTTEKKIELLGIKILQVKNEDRAGILDNVQSGIGPTRFFVHSEMDRLSFPVNLNERIFWVSKYINLAKAIRADQTMELLRYKFTYENIHGFNNMEGETELQTHTSELPELLFDIMSFRGKRMLDVAIRKNPIWISMRFRENDLRESNILALDAVKYFEEVYCEIEKILEIESEKT